MERMRHIKKGELLAPTLRYYRRERFFYPLLFCKKGQLGKGLTFLPTFVLVLVILVLFIGLVVGIITFKHVKPPVIVSFDLSRSPLLHTVILSFEGKEQQMFVVEALARYRARQISSRDFENSLKQLVSEEWPCFAFAQGASEHPARSRGGNARENYLISWNGGNARGSNPGYVPLGLATYERAGVLEEVSFSFQGKKIYVESYLGRCLDGS